MLLPPGLVLRMCHEFRLGNHDFVAHFFQQLAQEFETFSNEEKLALERAITDMQESAVPESEPFRAQIVQLRDSLESLSS